MNYQRPIYFQTSTWIAGNPILKPTCKGNGNKAKVKDDKDDKKAQQDEKAAPKAPPTAYALHQLAWRPLSTPVPFKRLFAQQQRLHQNGAEGEGGRAMQKSWGEFMGMLWPV